jgi:hypothetical protein
LLVPIEADPSPVSNDIVDVVEHQRENKDSKGSTFFLNSECVNVVDLGRRVYVGSLITERGLTQTRVKVPKFWLSVKQKGVFDLKQQGGKLRSSYPSKKA